MKHTEIMTLPKKAFLLRVINISKKFLRFIKLASLKDI